MASEKVSLYDTERNALVETNISFIQVATDNSYTVKNINL